MEPDWIGAIGTVAGALFGAGAIGWSAYSFKRTNEETSRPYVSASFEAVDRDDRVYFKVGNYGRTAATNIVIDFDDKLSNAEPSRRDFGAYLRRMFADPGITLSPGEFKQTIYQVPEGSQEPDEEVAPNELSGTVLYRGPAKFSKSGKEQKPGTQYVGGFSLDSSPMKHMLRVSRSDHDVEQRILKLTQQVTKVAHAIDRLDGSPNRESSLTDEHARRSQEHESLVRKVRNALTSNSKRG